MLRAARGLDDAARIGRAAEDLKVSAAAEAEAKAEAAAQKKASRWTDYLQRKAATGKPPKTYESWSRLYDTNQGQVARGNQWRDQRMAEIGITAGEGGWATELRVKTASGRSRVLDLAHERMSIAREFKSGSTPTAEALDQLAADEELVRQGWQVSWDLRKPLTKSVMARLDQLQKTYPTAFDYAVHQAPVSQ